MGERKREESESGLRLNGNTEAEIAEHFQEFLKSWEKQTNKQTNTTVTLEIKKYEGPFFFFTFFFIFSL